MYVAHIIFLVDSAALDHMKDNYKDGNEQLFSKSVVDRIKVNGFSMQRGFKYMKKDKLGLIAIKYRNWKKEPWNVHAYMSVNLAIVVFEGWEWYQETCNPVSP